MNPRIERNFIEIQKKITHVLVEQEIILTESKLTVGFLDKLNESKNRRAKAITAYHALIDMTVEYLSASRNVSELFLLNVYMERLIDITKRLVHTFGDPRFNNFYFMEVKTYKMLMGDIREILTDVQGRISNDKKLMDLLDNI